MKTWITRNYLTLEEVVNNYYDDVKGPLYPLLNNMIFDEVIRILAGQVGTQVGTAEIHKDKLFRNYIWPKFYNSTILYIDTDFGSEPTEEDIEEEAQEWAGRVFAWLEASSAKYIKLITLYENQENNLLNKVNSTSTTLFNDTPQNGSQSFVTDNYVTNATKVDSSTELNTPMARLKEIRDNLENLYATWAKEFEKFVMEY